MVSPACCRFSSAVFVVQLAEVCHNSNTKSKKWLNTTPSRPKVDDRGCSMQDYDFRNDGTQQAGFISAKPDVCRQTNRDSLISLKAFLRCVKLSSDTEMQMITHAAAIVWHQPLYVHGSWWPVAPQRLCSCGAEQYGRFCIRQHRLTTVLLITPPLGSVTSVAPCDLSPPTRCTALNHPPNVHKWKPLPRQECLNSD